MWALFEDRTAQLLQRRARFDAELLDQHVTGAAVRRQGVGLPPAAIQRKDEQLPGAFTERRAADLLLELTDDVGVPSQTQIGFDPTLDRPRRAARPAGPRTPPTRRSARTR